MCQLSTVIWIEVVYWRSHISSSRQRQRWIQTQGLWKLFSSVLLYRLVLREITWVCELICMDSPKWVNSKDCIFAETRLILVKLLSLKVKSTKPCIKIWISKVSHLSFLCKHNETTSYTFNFLRIKVILVCFQKAHPLFCAQTWIKSPTFVNLNYYHITTRQDKTRFGFNLIGHFLRTFSSVSLKSSYENFAVKRNVSFFTFWPQIPLPRWKEFRNMRLKNCCVTKRLSQWLNQDSH